MSGIHEALLLPQTLASIRLSEGHCGCELRGSSWWLCQYHDGYDTGAAQPMTEVNRARVADEVARRVLNDGEPIYFAVMQTIQDLVV